VSTPPASPPPHTAVFEASAPAPVPANGAQGAGEALEACPLCGAPLRSDQEWCLHCGAAARTRLATSSNWKAPLIAIAVIATLALGVLVAALADLAGSSTKTVNATIVTTVPATTPPAATTPTTPATTGPTSGATGATSGATGATSGATGATSGATGPTTKPAAPAKPGTAPSTSTAHAPASSAFLREIELRRRRSSSPAQKARLRILEERERKRLAAAR
jgi:hypothetical protein